MTLIKCGSSFVNSELISDIEVSINKKRNILDVTLYTADGDSYRLFYIEVVSSPDDKNYIDTIKDKVYNKLIPTIVKFINIGVEIIDPEKIMERSL